MGWVTIHGHPILIGEGGGGAGGGGAALDARQRQAHHDYNAAHARDLASGGDATAHAATLRAAADLHAIQREHADATIPLPKLPRALQERLGAHLAEHAARDPAHPAHDAAPRAFPDLAATDAWAKGHYDEWASKLSPKEVQAIRDYQGTEYDHINRLLRHDRVIPRAERAAITKDEQDAAGIRHVEALEQQARATVATLDRALAKAPPLPRPVTVQRAFAPRSTDFGALEAGHVIEDQGFVSTTFDPRTASRFEDWARDNKRTPIFASITLPTGARAGYIEHLGPQGRYGEYEMLLPRGGKYRVTGKRVDAQGRRFLDMEWEA